MKEYTDKKTTPSLSAWPFIGRLHFDCRLWLLPGITSVGFAICPRDMGIVVSTMHYATSILWWFAYLVILLSQLLYVGCVASRLLVIALAGNPTAHVRSFVAANILPTQSLQRCWLIARSLGNEYRCNLTAAQVRELIHNKLWSESFIMALHFGGSAASEAPAGIPFLLILMNICLTLPVAETNCERGLSRGQSASLAFELAKSWKQFSK